MDTISGVTHRDRGKKNARTATRLQEVGDTTRCTHMFLETEDVIRLAIRRYDGRQQECRRIGMSIITEMKNY